MRKSTSTNSANFISSSRATHSFKGSACWELRSSQQAEPLNECVARLDEMKLAEFVEVDFRIVRGLAYYTGIVFELFDARSSLRAICGGGRYDDLIKQGAGMDLPCVGFGMGGVVLGEVLKEHGKEGEGPTQLDGFLVA